MTIAYLILIILGTLSDLTELCYDMGQFTRNTILPALVYTYVVTEYVVTRAHKGLVNTFDTGETMFQSVSWG